MRCKGHHEAAWQGKCKGPTARAEDSEEGPARLQGRVTLRQSYPSYLLCHFLCHATRLKLGKLLKLELLPPLQYSHATLHLHATVHLLGLYFIHHINELPQVCTGPLFSKSLNQLTEHLPPNLQLGIARSLCYATHPLVPLHSKT
jgi:hypothetical protein